MYVLSETVAVVLYFYPIGPNTSIASLTGGSVHLYIVVYIIAASQKFEKA
jgi:hypothetical protein